jgi:excisionase family DNA binding protein
VFTQHQNPHVCRRLLVHHVAKRLGLSRRMVRHLAGTGILKAYKVGPKIWYFADDDVEAYRLTREAAHV